MIDNYGEQIMAIYAFDGTGNAKHADDEKNTNVVKFFKAYDEGYQANGENVYIRGVGTSEFAVNKLFGAALGFGGRRRINKALDVLNANFAKGDRRIDIVGFSRGAALALEFANEIYEKGINGEETPTIHFLGLWDTVGSFGVPGNNINLGYTLTVPRNVEHCFHALSLDERRYLFPLTRLVQDKYTDSGALDINEVWFRGFHSDVGGGNRNLALSSTPLVWMFEKAKGNGIHIPHERLEEQKNLRKPQAACKKPHMDQVPFKKRTIQQFDSVHDSVSWREWAHEPFFKANNPPKGLRVVNDHGDVLPGGFKKN